MRDKESREGFPESHEVHADRRGFMAASVLVAAGAVVRVAEAQDRHPGHQPVNTPVEKLLDAKHFGMLTPAAKKLTKADLQTLAAADGAQKLKLTQADVRSVAAAFNDFNKARTAGGAEAMAVSCCSCCPCCCAAASMEPVRIA